MHRCCTKHRGPHTRRAARTALRPPPSPPLQRGPTQNSLVAEASLGEASAKKRRRHFDGRLELSRQQRGAAAAGGARAFATRLQVWQELKVVVVLQPQPQVFHRLDGIEFVGQGNAECQQTARRHSYSRDPGSAAAIFLSLDALSLLPWLSASPVEIVGVLRVPLQQTLNGLHVLRARRTDRSLREKAPPAQQNRVRVSVCEAARRATYLFVLRVRLAEKAPALAAVRILLHLRLQTQHGLAHAPGAQESQRFFEDRPLEVQEGVRRGKHHGRRLCGREIPPHARTQRQPGFIKDRPAQSREETRRGFCRRDKKVPAFGSGPPAASSSLRASSASSSKSVLAQRPQELGAGKSPELFTRLLDARRKAEVSPATRSSDCGSWRIFSISSDLKMDSKTDSSSASISP